MKNSPDTMLRGFEARLKASGKAPGSIVTYLRIVRRFLDHIGNTGLDHISEEQTRAFFDGLEKQTKEGYTPALYQFLEFASASLPVVVAPVASVPKKHRKEIALRKKWTADKLTEKKNSDEDLIAKLARKVIDHYLYFQGRLKGEPENLDEVARLHDECRELIERNLPLFMKLSAEGRNIHSAIDEKVQK